MKENIANLVVFLFKICVRISNINLRLFNHGISIVNANIIIRKNGSVS